MKRLIFETDREKLSLFFPRQRKLKGKSLRFVLGERILCRERKRGGEEEKQEKIKFSDP